MKKPIDYEELLHKYMALVLCEAGDTYVYKAVFHITFTEEELKTLDEIETAVTNSK